MTVIEDPPSRNGNSVERYENHRVELDADKLDLIKRTLAADAGLTDNELKLFGEVAMRKGLDPFAQQIHAVKRQGKLVFQTGIDGYRLLAERTGKYAGQDAPEWCGDDGVWQQIWPKTKGSPVACRIRVYRRDWVRPVEVIAHWDEYVQTTKDGNTNSMWRSRGAAQLAKCAEALALRKAFPQDLSGVYTDEEMGQADNIIDANVVEAQARPQAPTPALETEPVFDVTGEIDQLDQDARGELTTWWKAILPRGVKAGAVPTHFIAQVRAKIDELRGDDGDDDGSAAPVPTPPESDDGVIDAEIVEDGVESGSGPTVKAATVSPPPQDETAPKHELGDSESSSAGPRFTTIVPPPAAPPTVGGVRDGKVMHSGKDVLTAVCRELSISPPERNHHASALFGRKISRITELSDNQCHDLARYLEDDTFAANRKKEAEAHQRLSDAFGEVEEAS